MRDGHIFWSLLVVHTHGRRMGLYTLVVRRSIDARLALLLGLLLLLLSLLVQSD